MTQVSWEVSFGLISTSWKHMTIFFKPSMNETHYEWKTITSDIKSCSNGIICCALFRTVPCVGVAEGWLTGLPPSRSHYFFFTVWKCDTKLNSHHSDESFKFEAGWQCANVGWEATWLTSRLTRCSFHQSPSSTIVLSRWSVTKFLGHDSRARKTLDVILSFETASPPFEYSSNSTCPWCLYSNKLVGCRFVPRY